MLHNRIRPSAVYSSEDRKDIGYLFLPPTRGLAFWVGSRVYASMGNWSPTLVLLSALLHSAGCGAGHSECAKGLESQPAPQSRPETPNDAAEEGWSPVPSPSSGNVKVSVGSKRKAVKPDR